MTELPGFTYPTLRAVNGWVQALSEYASTFTVFIVPSKGKVVEALNAARTVTATAMLVKTMAAATSLMFVSLTLVIWTIHDYFNKRYC